MTLTFRVETKEITQAKQKVDELTLYLQQSTENVAGSRQYKSDIIEFRKAIHIQALGGGGEQSLK